MHYTVVATYLEYVLSRSYQVMDSAEGSVPSNPHQPDTSFRFPKRSFGKTKVVEQAFQQSWFAKWTFLHYDEMNDLYFVTHAWWHLRKRKCK